MFSQVLLDPTGNAVNSSMSRVGGDEFRVSERGERGSNLSESGKEARERDWGDVGKIRANVAFDNVADDEVALRSDVALTCHICLG